MAARTTKEKRQIMILSILLGIVVLVVGYLQRDSFLPSVSAPAGTGIGTASRAAITVKATEDLFKDERFTGLKKNIDTGLTGSTTGNDALFAPPSP